MNECMFAVHYKNIFVPFFFFGVDKSESLST